MSRSTLFALIGVAAATFTLQDPSDVVGTILWEADNALSSNYNVPFISVQGIANVAPNYYSGETVNLYRETFSVDDNDTSVIVATEGSTLTLDHVTVIKEGYTSDLNEASFFGVNAAVWVGNDSIAYISDTNVTVHNGAANIYVYGTGSVVYVDHTFLYASGPLSHGIYASGNGTVYASNVAQYSGAYRSSAFAGDTPAGYVHVSDSTAHTDGLGSAICYALGLCNVTNVKGHASRSPVMFMDSVQEGVWKDCDVTAGLLAGMVLFGSSERQAGGSVTIDHTTLTTLGDDMASLWFGNTIASATIKDSVFNNSASGIFAIANMSQVTQDFDHFAGYEENSGISPAYATISVSSSPITGDVVAYNGSSINISFADYSTWEGAATWGYGSAYLGVSLDATSNWTVTGESKLQNFTNADSTLANVYSAGFTVYYNSSAELNSWLDGETVSLNGGGSLTPLEETASGY